MEGVGGGLEETLEKRGDSGKLVGPGQWFVCLLFFIILFFFKQAMGPEYITKLA